MSAAKIKTQKVNYLLKYICVTMCLEIKRREDGEQLEFLKSLTEKAYCAGDLKGLWSW